MSLKYPLDAGLTQNKSSQNIFLFSPQLFRFMHLLSHFLCSYWKRKAFSSAELSSSSEKGSVWGKTGISACQVPFFLEPEGEERAVTAGSYVLGGRWKNRGITQKCYINLRGWGEEFLNNFSLVYHWLQTPSLGIKGNC